MDELLYPFFVFQSILFLYWLFLLLKRGREKGVSYTPSVTVLIPAYNEEENIGRAINSVLSSGYPDVEVIVVDDGSTDRTGEIAREMGVKVVRTEHVGKAEALNRAIPHARGEIIIILDADTVIERGAIERIVEPLSDPDTVISVGKMKAEGRGILAGFQRIEYAFVSELLHAHTRNNKPLPFFFGAFMAVKREFLEEVGGFPTDTPGEDFDLFIEAMERGKKIAGTDARASTKVPETLPSLLEQRLRWGKAGLLITWKHRKIAHRYPLFLYPYWPLYGILGFPNLLEMFLRYIDWHVRNGTILEYLASWFTFYGPVNSLLKLPQWGFHPLTVLGVLLGLLSLAVIAWAWWRNGEAKDVIYLLFLPTYGTFLMGLILFLIIPYTLLTIRKRKFIR